MTGVVSSRDGRDHRIGVQRDSDGLVMRLDGESVRRTSALAFQLPLLVIRPESYEVFGGAAEERRRVLDWAVFHVEHDYGPWLARYARALKQRNAALRQGLPQRSVMAWDDELIRAATEVDAARSRFLDGCQAGIVEMIGNLTGRGW